MKYPSVSAIIPIYNEEKNLERLFRSLNKQKYPGKIEYIVVDDQSTDNGPRIAKKFGARVLKVKTHDIELNKGIGLHAAKGELVYWFDADMEVCSRDFFTLLAKPLVENKKIIASFTKEFALDGCGRKPKSSILRFISYHPLQQDPLYAFFSKDIEKQVIEAKKDYFICRFTPGKIPAVGRILYRKKELLKTDVGKDKSFIDMEAVEIVARAGHDHFAYVPKAKVRHYHAETLKLLVKKRMRNLERDYLPNYDHKHFTWFNPKDPKDVLKIVGWVIWANLLIPETIRGLYKMLKHRDIAFLWQPIVAIATTDAILWGFLSRPKGRDIAKSLLLSLIRR